MFFMFCFVFILHRSHVVGAQTAPSQSDVSFDHQQLHMLLGAFITFHSEEQAAII